MATYREINGGSIQNRATNPSNVKEGEVWYNEDTGKLRYGKFTEGSPTSASWATGGNLNLGRFALGGAGTQTAALAFAGVDPNYYYGETESYNGSSWTEVNDTNTDRADVGSNGTQTSALLYGGRKSPGGVQTTENESWNGSNWTEVGDLNTARQSLAGAGADNTAAVAFGGFSPAGPTSGSHGETEVWNGSSWSEVADLNQVRNDLAGTGIYTSALAVGGIVGGQPPSSALTETWNGSSNCTISYIT